jgi:hypothetical protein
MKEKILAKIYETCPELNEAHECSCLSREDTFTEPQLNHLLRTIGEAHPLDITKIGTDGGFYNTLGHLVFGYYDLTKTVSENLENEELANFIGEIILLS